MDYLQDIIKEIGEEFTTLASEITEVEQYVDTGSYIFNGLCSGSIFGGVSSNRITAIAGESSTGKTFFSLAVVKNFLDTNPSAYVLYFDTEASITRSLLESREIDLSRVVVVNVVTIEEFRQKALKAVDIYLKKSEDERKSCMFVLDSLGMLSTEKEITDALNEKQVRDMTKSQLVKGAFRMLTLKLGQANIPLIVTNHTYDVIGSYVPTKEMGGGSGLKYAASTIIYLGKKKEKDGTEVVGNIIKAKTHKSRLSKEVGSKCRELSRQPVGVRLAISLSNRLSLVIVETMACRTANHVCNDRFLRNIQRSRLVEKVCARCVESPKSLFAASASPVSPYASVRSVRL